MLTGHRLSRFGVSSLIAIATLAPIGAHAFDQSPFGDLHWRLIGPFRGGRAIAVAGVPSQPEKFYFGGVGGGVWVTENAGRTWKPIFDQVPVASIGAVAVSESDPNVIYVGTGEADMRSDIQQGSGMFKSLDSGKTWKSIGLTDSRQIGRIIVDPKDPNIVYVAAMGHQYGPNTQRGVYKSTDGGQSWTRVLYKNQDVGAINLAMDPHDPNTLFACLWQTRRPTWNVYPPSYGPGSGLYKSTDAGVTWTPIVGHGFPSHPGRIGITISPAVSNRIYAMVDHSDAKLGGAYRSDDGGATWTHTDNEGRIWGRGWYFSEVAADPKNSDVVYAMNTSTYRSTDAGKTFTPIKGAPGGDDYHTMWIHPNDPSRIILGSDQGVVVSVDGAKSWSSWYNQPTGQFYHVVTDNRVPYWVYGSQQDSGAMAVPSRTIHTGISAMDTRPIDVGGESGTIAPDPLHPGSLLGNNGVREELDDAWEQAIDPLGMFPDTDWRSTWTLPIVVSPQDPHVFYTSHQQILRTGDSGKTWRIISPDLSRPTNYVPPTLDPATVADSDGKPRRGVVYWLSASPVRAKTLWAGTDDGLIWLTRDEGKHWANVTPAALTPWSKVGVIDASHFDSNAAYAAIDRHRLDDNRPFIYRTRDGGKHWKLITNGLPKDQWLNVVKEDPKRQGLLYAGSDRGVYVSLNDGETWNSLQLNLPAASVRDIVFGADDVVVGTHGRAIWVLDDASPLRQLKQPLTNAVTKLFKPASAMIFQRSGTFGFGMFDEGTPFPPEEPQGQNPEWGAKIDYAVPGGKAVHFTISDAKGQLLRAFSSIDKGDSFDLKHLDIPAYWVHPKQPPSATLGAHRLVWDFHTRTGLVVPPGTYTITMSVGGKSYSQPLTVQKDPRVKASDAELRAQYAFALQISDEIQVIQGGVDKIQKMLKNPALNTKSRNRLLTMMGKSPKDIGSLRYQAALLGSINATATGAASAPISAHFKRFKQIRSQVQQILTRL